MCNRAVLLHGGQVVTAGGVEEVIEAYLGMIVAG
jgi:ABC-type polysaccharide/polyol phosphate transport system ATPase subunit